MSKKFVFIIPFLVLAISFRSPDKKVAVSGIVMRTGVFCGGMELSPEEAANIYGPKPFSTQILYVKKGKVNDFKAKPVLQFVSGGDGKFSFSLPPGEYCIVNEYKKNKYNYELILQQYKEPTKNYTEVNEPCLALWFKTPDLIFTVGTDSVKNLVVTYSEQCSWNAIPCVQFLGPPPP